MSFRFAVLLLPFCFLACQDDDDVLPASSPYLPVEVPGIYYGDEPNGNLTVLYDSLIGRLNGNPNVSIVAEVDHAQNAANAGSSLRPTRLVMFGNPNLGTPIMQANPLAGLDLPQKMLVYEVENGDVIMIFNDTEYLADRHGVGGVSTLSTIRSTLVNLPTLAGVSRTVDATGSDVERNEGIVTFTAAGTVDSVYTALTSALDANAAISIIAELDHQANAASVNMELPPLRLIVFGNPNLGTPLLREAQTIGLDLPQKMLVYESAEGEVTVAYNDPYYLADRHGVDENLAQLGTISDALEGLAKGALGL